MCEIQSRRKNWNEWSKNSIRKNLKECLQKLAIPKDRWSRRKRLYFNERTCNLEGKFLKINRKMRWTLEKVYNKPIIVVGIIKFSKNIRIIEKYTIKSCK